MFSGAEKESLEESDNLLDPNAFAMGLAAS